MVLLMPFNTAESWSALGSQAGQIAYIMFAQAFAGIAKDLVKLAGKSTTKLATRGNESSRLFTLVVFLTGFKNEMKGVGFFVGTLLQAYAGFLPSLIILTCLNLMLLPAALYFLQYQLGRTERKNISFASTFRKSTAFNLLCAARFFLFGSRDIWFEVALPIFLTNVADWDALAVGAFLAGWTIIYGIVQSATGPIALRPTKCFPPQGKHLWPWAAQLTGLVALVAALFTATNHLASTAAIVGIIVPGLLLYAVVFAVNSAIHSYVAVELSDKDKVAMDVGFYYMANAAGRLVGTLLGGVLYSYYDVGVPEPEPGHAGTSSPAYDVAARLASFTACLWGSAIFAAAATGLSVLLWRKGGGPPQPRRSDNAHFHASATPCNFS